MEKQDKQDLASIIKKINDNIPTIIVTCIIIASLLVVIYICKLIKGITGDFDWGSLVGGIGGGLLTLVGVRYTIKSEKEKERVRLRHYYNPFQEALFNVLEKFTNIKERHLTVNTINKDQIQRDTSSIYTETQTILDTFGKSLLEVSPLLYYRYLSQFQYIRRECFHLRSILTHNQIKSTNELIKIIDTTVSHIIKNQQEISDLMKII